MKKAIIVDLDGVLCDNSHRMPLIEGEEKNWTDFFNGIPNDEPIEATLEIIRRFQKDHLIFFMTARPATMRIVSDTLNWLLDYNIRYIDIFFREESDMRPSFEVKKDLFEKYLKDEYEVVFALEDCPRTANMWREQGIMVYQTEYIHPTDLDKCYIDFFGQREE